MAIINISIFRPELGLDGWQIGGAEADVRMTAKGLRVSIEGGANGAVFALFKRHRAAFFIRQEVFRTLRSEVLFRYRSGSAQASYAFVAQNNASVPFPNPQAFAPSKEQEVAPNWAHATGRQDFAPEQFARIIHVFCGWRIAPSSSFEVQIDRVTMYDT